MPRDESLKVFAQAFLQRSQGFGESRLVARGEPHLPLRQLGHQLAPLAPGERPAAAALELAEACDEVARQPLLADAVALEQARDDRKHLARMDRLHEVVVDFGADGVAQQREAATAGHLLVEQHDAVRLAPQHREGVVAVRRLRHRKPLLLEKAPVRGKAVNFVVNPENALRTRHLALQASPAGEAGQRATTLAACFAFCASGSAPSATFSSPLPSCARCTGAIPTPSSISSRKARWRRWSSRIRT